MRERFWEAPLASLSNDEWEALCDGCGRCCLHKLQDEDDDAVFFTDIACHLFDPEQCRCGDYPNRLQQVPDCLSIREQEDEIYDWLPPTCAYRLRYQNRPLPEWHPLISGCADSVHEAGISVRHRTVSEADVDEEDYEEHIILWIKPQLPL